MTIASLDALPTKIPTLDRVYLSGPMTGLREFNYPMFRTAAAALVAVGYDVYDPTESPAALDDTTGLDGTESADAVGFDVRAAFADYTRYLTTEADAIALLPGWENSTGARGEVALALAIGLPVLDALSGVEVRAQITARTTPLLSASDEHDLDASIARHPAGRAPGPRRTVGQTLDVVEQRPVLTAVPSPAPTIHGQGTGEIRVTSATGGQKGVKEAQFSLIPPGPLKELAVLYGRGNVKYPPEPGEMANWKRGYSWSLSYDALKRHLDLWWSRTEDHDAEMGVKHLINVAWHAFNLAWFMENRPEFDDRPGVGETYVGALPTPQWITDLQAERATAAQQ